MSPTESHVSQYLSRTLINNLQARTLYLNPLPTSSFIRTHIPRYQPGLFTEIFVQLNTTSINFHVGKTASLSPTCHGRSLVSNNVDPPSRAFLRFTFLYNSVTQTALPPSSPHHKQPTRTPPIVFTAALLTLHHHHRHRLYRRRDEYSRSDYLSIRTRFFVLRLSPSRIP